MGEFIGPVAPLAGTGHEAEDPGAQQSRPPANCRPRLHGTYGGQRTFIRRAGTCAFQLNRQFVFEVCDLEVSKGGMQGICNAWVNIPDRVRSTSEGHSWIED